MLGMGGKRPGGPEARGPEEGGIKKPRASTDFAHVQKLSTLKTLVLAQWLADGADWKLP
eukprot:gene18208-24656_t